MVDTGLYELVFCLLRMPAGRGSGSSPSGTVRNPARPVADITSRVAAPNPTGSAASPLNPAQTIIKLPEALQWETHPCFLRSAPTFVL